MRIRGASARCRNRKDLCLNIEEASHKIADLLLATDAYKSSNTILLHGRRAVTDGAERALEDGKRVGIPLCVGPHEMVVKEYKNSELGRCGSGLESHLLKLQVLQVSSI